LALDILGLIQQLDIILCTVLSLVSLSRKRTARESSRTQLRSTQQRGYALACLLEIYQKTLKHGCLYNLDTQWQSHVLWTKNLHVRLKAERMSKNRLQNEIEIPAACYCMGRLLTSSDVYSQ